MKFWGTEIEAINAQTGEIKKYCGPNVPGISQSDAENYCQTNGLGYCKVIGELVAEIPCKNGTHEPDFKNMTDYETQALN